MIALNAFGCIPLWSSQVRISLISNPTERPFKCSTLTHIKLVMSWLHRMTSQLNRDPMFALNGWRVWSKLINRNDHTDYSLATRETIMSIKIARLGAPRDDEPCPRPSSYRRADDLPRSIMTSDLLKIKSRSPGSTQNWRGKIVSASADASGS